MPKPPFLFGGFFIRKVEVRTDLTVIANDHVVQYVDWLKFFDFCPRAVGHGNSHGTSKTPRYPLHILHLKGTLLCDFMDSLCEAGILPQSNLTLELEVPEGKRTFYVY